MLEKLGFHVGLDVSEQEDGPCLNIVTNESAVLIGKDGDRLEDLQYLTNRILCKHYPDAPRVKVDCDSYRAQKEERLMETMQSLAKQVLDDGKTRKAPPLNAYYRRLAHHALSEEEGVSTRSPKGSSRYKRIEIRKN
ncbi:MAG: hypothetical protein KJO21_04495 [Verrucomicrobiae bacterium]|nr:hypothetical protein [Verrucomicrobiae bacterium]NNJ42983.1 hypothetical protein [Akkermansiaceae bacterium]